jgi:SET domain
MKHKGRKSNRKPAGVDNLHIFMALVAIAYYLLSESGRPSPVHDRFLSYWPMGDNVAVQTLSNPANPEDLDRGLVATRTIRQGEVVLTADYTDLGGDLALQEPTLRGLLQQALQEAIQEENVAFVNLASSLASMMGTLRFLQLVDLEQDPKWLAFAETLPQNVTQMAWYWTPDERTCVVARPNDRQSPHLRSVFHATMVKVARVSDLVRQIYSNNPLRAEWAYLMMKTRGFGEFYFIPGLDLANHNPLQAAPPFLFVMPGQYNNELVKKVYLVAARDIPKGSPVYNTYGPLTTVKAAEFYGFVPSIAEAAYFESPSLHRDLLHSPATKDLPHCAGESVRFFGSHVGDQVVAAHYAGRSQSTRFKAMVPTSATYACLEQLVLGSTSSTNNTSVQVARYVATKLKEDYQQYLEKAQDEGCQSEQGNFPLIRQTNLVTAQLLLDAYRYAEQVVAANGEILYPGL